MNPKDLIEQFKNEDGSIDEEGLAKAVQDQFGTIASQARKKAKGNNTKETDTQNQSDQVTQEEGTSEESSDPTKDVSNIQNEALLKEVMQSVDGLKKELSGLKNENKAQDFKKRAADLNVDPNIVEAFISSGANLDEIDLESLRTETVPDEEETENTSETNSDSDEGNFNSKEDLLELARKMRGR